MGLVLSWVVRHPAWFAIVLLLISTAGSAALAKHEMKRANGLEAQLQIANDEAKRIHENEIKLQEISHDYQKRISSLNSKLSAARMLKPTCLIPSTPVTGRLDAAASNGAVMGQVGIDSSWADELIAEGTRYQEQLRALQSAVKETCEK